jgi:hypothetical protein
MKKLILLLLAIAATSGVASALSLNIEVGDHPYYVHGAGYWANGVYWVWVPGHWGPHHRHWIHGHYARR